MKGIISLLGTEFRGVNAQVNCFSLHVSINKIKAIIWDSVSLHSSGWHGTCYVVQAGLKQKIVLAQPLPCWDHRHATPHLLQKVILAPLNRWLPLDTFTLASSTFFWCQAPGHQGNPCTADLTTLSTGNTALQSAIIPRIPPGRISGVGFVTWLSSTCLRNLRVQRLGNNGTVVREAQKQPSLVHQCVLTQRQKAVISRTCFAYIGIFPIRHLIRCPHVQS